MSHLRETDADRRKEDEVARLLAAAWNCEPIRTRDQSRVDTLFMRDKSLVAVAEIKARRNRQFATFPSVQLNLQKWFSLVQFEMAAEVPAFMVFAFDDGIYYVRAATIHIGQFRLSVRGRTDRPGIDERQPVIEIGNLLWKRLREPAAEAISG